MHDDPVFHEVFRQLRGQFRADVRFDEHLVGIRFAPAADGRLIAPVMVAMLQTFDIVMFVPDLRDDALELMVSLEPFDEHSADGGAAADRWRIYHGEPDDVNWAFVQIDAAKHDGIVVDGEALMQPNALASHEAGLCREINTAHQSALTHLVKAQTGVGVESPVLVGVDPMGFNVRGRFDVHRVESDHPMVDANDAIATLVRLDASTGDES